MDRARARARALSLLWRSGPSQRGVRAQARAGELAFGPDHDVGDLLQFPAPPLLPLDHGAPQPGLGGAHLGGGHFGGGHLGGGHLGAGGHLGGPASGHAGLDAGGGGGLPHALEVKSEGMDAMLEMFLRVRALAGPGARIGLGLGLGPFFNLTESRVYAGAAAESAAVRRAWRVSVVVPRERVPAHTLNCVRALRGSADQRGAAGRLGQSVWCCHWHGAEVGLAELLLAVRGPACSAQAVAHAHAIGHCLTCGGRCAGMSARACAGSAAWQQGAWVRCVQPGRLRT